MARCAAIKANGERCKGIAIGSEWCYQHDPEHAEERKRNAQKGGRRGGRGRPLGEVGELKDQLKDLAAGVLDHRINAGVATIVNQIINTRLRAIELERRIREQDEILERIEELERSQESQGGSKRWGA